MTYIPPIHAIYTLTYETLSARYGPPNEQNQWNLHHTGHSEIHVVLDPRFVGHARIWLFDPAHSDQPFHTDIHSVADLLDMLARISGAVLTPA